MDAMKMNKSAPVIGGVLLLRLLLLLMWRAAHRPVGEGPATPAPSPSPTVVQTPHITRLFPGGKKQWKIGARSLEVNKKTNKGRAEHVTWELMDEKERAYVKAEAPAAEIDMKTKSVDFIGPVTARGKKDESARINKLYFDGPKNRFYGTKGVHIKKGESELTGSEMEIDPESRNFEIKGGVKVIYRSREKILSD